MTLGNLLLRPQLLGRKHRSEEMRVMNSLVALAVFLSRDIAGDGASAKIIQAAFLEATRDLRTYYEGRILSAGDSVRAWFKPVIDIVEESADAASAAEPGDVFAALTRLLIKAIEEWCSDDLEDKLNAFGDLLENELGLTKDRLLGPVPDLVERIIDDLTRDYLSGVQNEDTKNSFLIGKHIATLRTFFLAHYAELDLPSLNRRQLLALFVKEFKNNICGDWLKQIIETLEQLEATLKNLSGLFKTDLSIDVDVKVDVDVNFSAEPIARQAERLRSFSPDSLSGEQMSWYATWFYHSRFGLETVQVPERLKIDVDTFDKEISFKKISGEGMENWAHFMSAISDLLEGGIHLASNEQGDRASNLFNFGFQFLKNILTLSAYDHKGDGWVNYLSITDNFIFEHILSFFGTTIGSVEQHPGADDAWALSNLFPDIGETFLYSMWSNSLREFMLSLLTLINADPKGQSKSKNHERVEGFVLGWLEMGAWIGAFLPFAFRWGRKHYGAPAHNPLNGLWIVLYIVVGGIGIGGYTMSLIGWAVGGAIAGKPSDEYWKGEKLFWLKTLLFSIVKWPLYWFLMWDGNTDGGCFGLDDQKNEVKFPGYPRPENSPYKLPYAKGKLHQCVQGNYGVWSHNPDTSQVYAFDFNHNEGDKVLAMRGGTVLSFRDDIKDNSTEEWNSVTIVHNDSKERAYPDPEHDRDHRGIIPTSGQYGHGQHFGVRYAFASRGVPYPYIWGSKVKQGDLIMYAGDTGMSAYNHLHVHIVPEIEMNGKLSTIPFVFKEVEQSKALGFIPRPYSRDGLPRAFNYYVSDNELGKWGAELSLYHPAYHASLEKGLKLPIGLESRKSETRTIKSSGPDSAILNYYVQATDDDVYNGFFITAGSELQLIKKYTFDEDTLGGEVLLEKNWHSRPAPGTAFKILARIRVGGPDFVILDPAANAKDDAYKGAHILIKYKIEKGGKETERFEYKKIIHYYGETKLAVIQGEWDHGAPPPPGSEFEIGGLRYKKTKSFFKRFAYFHQKNELGDPMLLAKSKRIDKYEEIGKYHDAIHEGAIGANVSLPSDLIKLADDASDEDEFYTGRHIVVKKGGNLVQYKKIIAYTGATREAKIEGGWETELKTSDHTYEIGAPAYEEIEDEKDILKKNAFLCPDATPGEYSPLNFDDGTEKKRNPYRYLTFNSSWPALKL